MEEFSFLLPVKPAALLSPPVSLPASSPSSLTTATVMGRESQGMVDLYAAIITTLLPPPHLCVCVYRLPCLSV